MTSHTSGNFDFVPIPTQPQTLWCPLSSDHPDQLPDDFSKHNFLP